MPTPFMHLDYAERMLRSDKLAASLVDPLRAQWSAFYLGSVSADYQSICDVPREHTHFYKVPLEPEHDAIGQLFDENAALASAAALSAEKRIFMAAYIAHLNFDLVWYRQVLLPHFAFNDKWGDTPWRERFTVHNILLTYLDQQSQAALPDSAETTLGAATSPTDISFLQPDPVTRFQTMLVEQLAPGAQSRTIEVYAGRMGITPAEFGQHLDNASWMQSKLFDRVPLDNVLSVLEQTVHDSAELISAYLT